MGVEYGGTEGRHPPPPPRLIVEGAQPPPPPPRVLIHFIYMYVPLFFLKQRNSVPMIACYFKQLFVDPFAILTMLLFFVFLDLPFFRVRECRICFMLLPASMHIYRLPLRHHIPSLCKRHQSKVSLPLWPLLLVGKLWNFLWPNTVLCKYI